MVKIIRLFTKTPSLLLNSHIVHFSEKYRTGETDRYANQYFMVTDPQQVSYDRYYILYQNDYVDIDLHNASSGTENIYPEAVDELYEVLLGIEGDVLTYPIIPSPDRHFQKLGYTGMIPDSSDDTKRYLGCYKESDIPYESLRLRLTFVKNLDPMILRIYIDSPKDYEKAVIRFLINRCRIKKLERPTPEQMSIARKILHYSELKKGSD